MGESMKVMDQKRALDKKSLLDDLSIAAIEEDPEQISEDLYAVIVDKTRNDAASKVKLVKPGDGWGAFESIYLWLNAASGLAVQERLRRIMQPQSPKKIEDVPSVVESLHKEVEELKSFGPDYVMSPAFKMMSLKVIMQCKSDQLDVFSVRLPSEIGVSVTFPLKLSTFTHA